MATNSPVAQKPEGLRTPVEDQGPVPQETDLNEKASTFLQYVGGRASHREITKTQWAEVGITHDTVVFGPLNGLLVAVGTKGGLSKEAVDKLLTQKDENGIPEFRLVDSKGEPKNE